MKAIIFSTTLVFSLTSCLDKSTNIKTTKEFIKTKDANVQLIVDYLENGNANSVIVRNSDSTQSVFILIDSAGIVGATRIEKNGKRTHAIEYYKNGRPKGLTNFDSTITGDVIYYYDNGNKKSEGRWTNGHQTGIWKNYNDKGYLIKIDTLE